MVKSPDDKSEKKNAILQAALELFVERGFHATTVPAVAAKANVGAGTIYRYFANKDALVNSLFRSHKCSIRDMILRTFPGGGSSKAQFHAFWQALCDFSMQEPEAFAFLELHHHEAYLDEESKQLENELLDFARGFIEHAQAKNEVKQINPILLIGIVLGAFVGVMRKHREGHIELSPELFAQAEQCCWEAIRA